MRHFLHLLIFPTIFNKSSEGNFTSLLLCIYSILCKLRLIKSHDNSSVYADFDNFCPIITHSSTLLTMPVAFIYLSPFTILYGTTVPRCHCEESRTLVWQSPKPTASLRLPRRCAPRNDSGSRYLPTIILQITLLVSVNKVELYWLIYFL